jgi:hypothetical protein
MSPDRYHKIMAIGIADVERHVYAVHMVPPEKTI